MCALIGRHLEKKGDDFEVMFGEKAPPEVFETELDSIAAMLFKATSQIHERLKSNCKAELEALERELDVARDS